MSQLTAIEVLPPGLLSSAELEELRFAARCLEGRSFASRAAAVLGRQVEAFASLAARIGAPPRRTRRRGRAEDGAAGRAAHDRH